MKRMYREGEDIFYYLTLYNENYAMPAMPEGVEEGILKGLYKFRAGAGGQEAQGADSRQRTDHSVRAARAGNSRRALRCVRRCVERDELQAACATTRFAARRWNMLHPTADAARSPTSKRCWRKSRASFVAVSDNMSIVPDQIAPWVPGGLMTLGTDGFGRSDTRATLRRFFEVDAEVTVTATLHALARRGEVNGEFVAKAIGELGVDPEKACPEIV